MNAETGRWEQYNECEEIAFQAGANDQVASGIDDKNLPNSIILYEAFGP